MTIEEVKETIISKIVERQRTCCCRYRTCRLPDPLALPEIPEGAEIVKVHIGRIGDSDIRKLREECEAWNKENSNRHRVVVWKTGEWHECDTVRGEYGAPYVFEAKFNAVVIETKGEAGRGIAGIDGACRPESDVLLCSVSR